MKSSFVILILLSVTLSQHLNAQSLEDYQWKNRILLLFDATPNSDALTSQLTALTQDKTALKNRDLIIFRVTPDAVYAADGSAVRLTANEIFNKFNVDSNFNGVVLIGKDGGPKLKKTFEVPPRSIFDLIDGMPMRRAEMRKKGKH